MQNLQSNSFDSNTVKSCNYTNNLFRKLFSALEKQELCDICIIGSDDARFHAHKIVLSVASDFFKAMFGGALKKSKASEVRIQEVNGETFKPILEYMYTGIINLHTETITEILRGANFLQIKPLIEECSNFMENKLVLDAKNCLRIALYANQHDLKELSEKAFKFACVHFDQITKEEEFLKLNKDQLSKIISSETLCAASQEQVFSSLIQWIEHDKVNREKFTFQLFSNVMTVLNSKECSKITSLNEKLVIINRGMKLTFKPHLEEELGEWTPESLPGFPSSFKKIVEINNTLIISNENSSRLQCYDLKKNKMSELPPLKYPRIDFGLAVLYNELYVIGGKNPKSNYWKRLVDKYNFTSGKWEHVAPMTNPISKPVVTVSDGCLYVKGDDFYVDCFSPDSIKWTSIVLPKPNSYYFGLTAIKEKLFFVGGPTQSHHSLPMKRIYILDPSSGRWEDEEMNIASLNPKCTTWRDRLIVSGGEVDTFLNIVQKYNPVSKEWGFLPPVGFLNGDYEILTMLN